MMKWFSSILTATHSLKSYELVIKIYNKLYCSQDVTSATHFSCFVHCTAHLLLFSFNCALYYFLIHYKRGRKYKFKSDVSFLDDCSLSYLISETCVISQGFVAAHTLPVLYEKYEDQVDSFVYQVLGQMQHNYKKLDSGVLSKIPKGRFIAKKLE